MNKQLKTGQTVQVSANHWSYRRSQSGRIVSWTHPASKAQLDFAPFVRGSMCTWKQTFYPVLFEDGKVFFVEKRHTYEVNKDKV